MRKTTRSLIVALSIVIGVPAGVAAGPFSQMRGLAGAAPTLDAVELVKKGGGKGGKAFKGRHFKVKHAGKHRSFYRARYARRAHHRRAYHRSRIVYRGRPAYYRGHFHCHRHYRYGGIVRHCHWHRHGHH